MDLCARSLPFVQPVHCNSLWSAWLKPRRITWGFSEAVFPFSSAEDELHWGSPVIHARNCDGSKICLNLCWVLIPFIPSPVCHYFRVSACVQKKSRIIYAYYATQGCTTKCQCDQRKTSKTEKTEDCSTRPVRFNSMSDDLVFSYYKTNNMCISDTIQWYITACNDYIWKWRYRHLFCNSLLLF